VRKDREGSPSSASVNLVFQSHTVAIQDWHCAGGPVEAEESSDRYHVAVTRCGAYVREANRERVLADAATAVFYELGQAYRVSHPVKGGDVCTVFTLPAEGVRQLVGQYVPAVRDRVLPSFLTSRASVDCRDFLLHRLALSAAFTDVDPLLAEEAALTFLDRVLRRAYSGEPICQQVTSRSSAALDCAERVRAVVAGGFRQTLSLADIAREVGFSAYHLSRLFRSITGDSIHRYLVRVRLRHAIERMLETRSRLSVIALEVGFASHSHFTDTFKREFGLPPASVRSLTSRDLREALRRFR